MYRFIFLLLFFIPIHGMFNFVRPTLDLDPSPAGVLHHSNLSSNTFNEMITVENIFVKKASQRAGNTISSKFSGERGAQVLLTEAEAELNFHSFVRKYGLVKFTKEELLAKLKS
jgi:hypothetical protein